MVISVQRVLKMAPIYCQTMHKNIFESVTSKAYSNWNTDALTFVQYTYSKVQLNLNYSTKKVFVCSETCRIKKMEKEIHVVIWK